MQKTFFGLLILLLATTTGAGASTIQLPRSGQTTCYDSAGEVIVCTGTGQDGDKLTGAPWPQTRFTDNADGTVTDNMTGLVWLKKAGCVQPKIWTVALNAVKLVASGANCSLQDGSMAGDWRLPNRTEMLSLVDLQNSGPALPDGHPFTGVDPQASYWTSTNESGYADKYAYAVIISSGEDWETDKDTALFVWPVRGTSGGTGKVALPRTGQTSCYNTSGAVIACTGTGQDGDKLAGAVWPAHRFTDNINGTVTDNLTGMIWLKNANCYNTETWQDALSGAGILANGSCGLSDGSTAGDWRLPNITEMNSLLDMEVVQNEAPTIQAGYPFVDVVADYFGGNGSGNGNYYWTSTTDSTTDLMNHAWQMDLYLGGYRFQEKSGLYYVWPARGGHFGNSVISVAPTANDYGTVALNNSSAQTFTISNSNTATSKLQVNAITLSGTDAPHFILNKGNGTGGTCGPTPILAPGASCTLTIAFAPTIAMIKSATLRISASDVVTPNTDIALVGNKPVNGLCGSSDKSTFTVAPAGNFCSAGTATAATGTGPWEWKCTGLNGGMDATCSASIQTYSVTFAAGANGSVSGSTSQAVPHGGSTTTVTANPDTGFHFVNWTGTLTSTANPLAFGSVTGDLALTANFAVGNGAANGDINGDGKIDVFDALLVLQYSLNLIPHTPGNEAQYLASADVAPLDAITGKPKGGDGINIFDALMILQRSVNLIVW